MTEVDVINMALAKLGQPQLTPKVYAEQLNQPAQACKLFFGQARDSLLRRHNWSFAMELFQSKGEQDGTGKWQHHIPVESNRIVTVMEPGGSKIEHYTIAGRRIICGHANIWVAFVMKEPAMEFWDALFTECVVVRLAAYLAGSICQNPSLENQLVQQLEQTIFPRAITADAREVLSNENHVGVKNLMSSLLLQARL